MHEVASDGLAKFKQKRLIHMKNMFVLFALSNSVAGAAFADCADGHCEIEHGTYEISLPSEPQDAQSNMPAVIFLHGFGGSGKGVMTMSSMVSSLNARGYAVIAPDGSKRRDGRQSWGFLPGFSERDDVAFLQDVATDVATRFGVSQERTVLAGFSAGGFMVNYTACAEPGSFAAYAPVSGGFWRPQPESCAGPIRLFHSHGWRDGVVPLEGRALRNGQFIQGDIWAGLELWRETNGCDTHAPNKMDIDDGLMTRSWTCETEDGTVSDISFELFPGGHQVPKGWGDRLVDWFDASHLGG